MGQVSVASASPPLPPARPGQDIVSPPPSPGRPVPLIPVHSGLIFTFLSKRFGKQGRVDRVDQAVFRRVA